MKINTFPLLIASFHIFIFTASFRTLFLSFFWVMFLGSNKVWAYLSWDSFSGSRSLSFNEKYSSAVVCLLLFLRSPLAQKASYSDYEAKCDSLFTIHKLCLIQLKLSRERENFWWCFMLPFALQHKRTATYWIQFMNNLHRPREFLGRSFFKAFHRIGLRRSVLARTDEKTSKARGEA